MNLCVLCAALLAASLPFAPATSNPQHDRHHKNVHLPVRCRIDNALDKIPVEQLTETQLASFRTVEGQPEECLLALKPAQIAKMPPDLFQSAATHQHTLPMPFKLALLKSNAGHKLEPFAAVLAESAGGGVGDLDAIVLQLDKQQQPDATDIAAVLFRHVNKFTPGLFSRLRAAHMRLIPASSFARLSAQQFAALRPEAISAFTYEQLVQLPPAAIAAMTPQQAAHFPCAETGSEQVRLQLNLLSAHSERVGRHPCLAVVGSLDRIADPAAEAALRDRCGRYIRNEAQARAKASSQLTVLMAAVSLFFFIVTL